MSSSAQLVLVPWLLGWEPPRDRTGFAAALHAGSCAGLAWALRSDLRALSARDLAGLAAASVPAAVVGLVAADAVEARLGRPPQLAALLAGAGLAHLLADRRPERPTPGPVITRDAPGGSRVVMGPRLLALAGLAQPAALVPGVSRSGAVLTALRAAGTPRAEAERLSLLLSLPVTAGAAGLTLVRAVRRGDRPEPGAAAGALAAALAAGVAGTAWRRHPGRPATAPAAYRLALGAAVALRLRARRYDR